MAETSTIEWTDATWNPITGCSIKSPGCIRCYAMKLAGTRLRNHPSRAGLTKHTRAGPVWTGEVRFNEGWLTQPLQWRRPRMVFVCAHGDLFHEGVPDEWIDRVFAVMALAPQHTFQVLTKRAERMRRYVSAVDLEALARYHAPSIVQKLHRTWPLSNVWLGVSAERQQEADERIPHLLATPAAVRFVSLEPLIGPISLTDMPSWSEMHRGTGMTVDALTGTWKNGQTRIMSTAPALDWIIVGGESGDGATPMNPAWARSLRDQCAAAGKLDRFFFKQWGQSIPCELVGFGDDGEAWRRDANGKEFWFFDELNKPRDQIPAVRMSAIGKGKAGRLLDGVEHNGMPAHLPSPSGRAS